MKAVLSVEAKKLNSLGIVMVDLWSCQLLGFWLPLLDLSLAVIQYLLQFCLFLRWYVPRWQNESKHNNLFSPIEQSKHS